MQELINEAVSCVFAQGTKHYVIKEGKKHKVISDYTHRKITDDFKLGKIQSIDYKIVKIFKPI